MTKTMAKNKLTKMEARSLSLLLRGQAEALAEETGMSKWTVYRVFQGKSDNPAVLKAANKRIREMTEEQPSEEVLELRSLLSEMQE
jgi:hypothetical protein